MTKRPIYMDYQASTPVDPRVLKAMMPYFTEKFGNPHSATHMYGWETEAAVDIAREDIATVINAQASQIYFTSGATEANNLAIKGVMQAYKGHKNHMVTLASEHMCVIASAGACANILGTDVTILGVGKDGLVDLDALDAAITDQTALVSIMAVNNEIGVIQPLADIGKIACAKGAIFHTDAAQAFGKIHIDVDAMHIDLLSISGHKTYGPKGIGALYHRDDQRLTIAPQMHGGGQEGGLRSGTVAPALVAGLGAAANIAHENRAQEETRLKNMTARLLGKLAAAYPAMIVNGSCDQRWAGNMNVSFPNIDGTRLLADTRGVALSSGSACSSAKGGVSRVLTAIGVSEINAKATLRIGIGRFTTDDEIDQAADIIIKGLQGQKKLII